MYYEVSDAVIRIWGLLTGPLAIAATTIHVRQQAANIAVVRHVSQGYGYNLMPRL